MKCIVTVKNWFYVVEEGKQKEYKAVYGETIQNEQGVRVGKEKPIFINITEVVAIVPIEAEIPKESEIRNWDMKEYVKITGESSIYVAE